MSCAHHLPFTSLEGWEHWYSEWASAPGASSELSRIPLAARLPFCAVPQRLAGAPADRSALPPAETAAPGAPLHGKPKELHGPQPQRHRRDKYKQQKGVIPTVDKAAPFKHLERNQTCRTQNKALKSNSLALAFTSTA